MSAMSSATIPGVFEQECRLLYKRMECAIMIKWRKLNKNTRPKKAPLSRCNK